MTPPPPDIGFLIKDETIWACHSLMIARQPADMQETAGPKRARRAGALPIKFSWSTSSLRHRPPSHGEHPDLLEDASTYWETITGSN